MLWLKAFHIVFMVTWFAGLFYLPRLFVYHLEAAGESERQRFCTMERKLFAIMSIGMAGTLIFGLWLWLGYWPLATRWLQAKLLLALGLVGYHHWLLVPMRALRVGTNRHSARFFRIVNEIPALFLIAIVLLAVLKP